MISWDEKPILRHPFDLTIHAWKGEDRMDTKDLPANRDFDPAGFYLDNPDVTYIEVCADTQCVAFYPKQSGSKEGKHAEG